MTTYKGIDDLLAAGLKPHRVRGDDVRRFFEKVRAKLYGTVTEAKPAEDCTVPVVSSTARPTFPLEVFPQPVENFARSVTAALRCPADFVGLAVLVVSGAAIGAARSLQVKGGWHEKPGLYAVIVAKPGTTKTPALRAVMQPIYEEQDRLYEAHKDDLRQYRSDLEAYQLAQRQDNATQEEPPSEPSPLRHLFAADTTVEALGNSLQDNRKGILLFRDELTAWVRGLDQYKGRGTDRQFYLSAWSGEMVKVDRRSQQGKPVIIPHPFLSVLGGIQPDLLTELEAEGGKEDGFIHRILFSYPADVKAETWTDDEISQADADEWRVVLKKLLNLQPVKPEQGSEQPKTLRFSQEGRHAFVKWYDALVADMNADGFPPELFGPWSKLKAHCARFAFIIHLLRVACGEAGDDHNEGDVDAEDVQRATRLCAYFQAHFRTVYQRLQQTQEDRRVESLVQWLTRRQRTRCTPREICRAGVCGIKTASEATALLKAAVDRGLGEAEGGKTTLKGDLKVFVLTPTSTRQPDKSTDDAATDY